MSPNLFGTPVTKTATNRVCLSIICCVLPTEAVCGRILSQNRSQCDHQLRPSILVLRVHRVVPRWAFSGGRPQKIATCFGNMRESGNSISPLYPKPVLIVGRSVCVSVCVCVRQFVILSRIHVDFSLEIVNS